MVWNRAPKWPFTGETQMGITLSGLQNLRDLGVFPTRGKILDIGSSNLYQADASGLETFAKSFGRSLDAQLAQRLAAGSAYGGVTKNESFVGELLEHIGLDYLSFDIANGYHTQKFDLNVEHLPSKLRSTFDVVLNYGTTEHIFDQLNSFRVIHDAVKVGGHIVHQLPAAGHIRHGYFCYTPRFFFDLAGHNEYEIVHFSYNGPIPGPDIHQIVRDYAAYFPALTKNDNALSRSIEDLSLDIVLKKIRDLPLRLPVETSTSVVVDSPSKGMLARLFQ